MRHKVPGNEKNGSFVHAIAARTDLQPLRHPAVHRCFYRSFAALKADPQRIVEVHKPLMGNGWSCHWAISFMAFAG